MKLAISASGRIVVGIVLAAALAQGHCPHQCSGHGRCGEVSKCECFTTWAGGDCSQRACAAPSKPFFALELRRTLREMLAAASSAPIIYRTLHV